MNEHQSNIDAEHFISPALATKAPPWSIISASGYDWRAPRGGAFRDVQHADRAGTLRSNRRTQRATIEASPFHRAIHLGEGQRFASREARAIHALRKSGMRRRGTQHAEIAKLRALPVPPQAEDYFDLPDGEEKRRADLISYARLMNKRKARRRIRGGR